MHILAKSTLAAGLGIATVATALLAPTAQADPGRHDQDEAAGLVAQVRRAIQPFHDVAAAEAAGYVQVGDCEQSPAGAMGYHFLNYGNITFGAPDPAKPTLLLYGPDGSGGLKLLGAEFFQPDIGQDRPTLGGEPFDGPMAGHSPGMPTHYDLHVWTEVANPNGVFAQWNPRVTC